MQVSQAIIIIIIIINIITIIIIIIYSREIVKCENKECNERVERREIDTHQQGCIHRKVSCVHCGMLITAAIERDHLNTCPKLEVPCTLSCGFITTRDMMARHIRDDCLMVDTQCEVIGCGAKMKRRDITKHEEEAAKVHTRLLSSALVRMSAGMDSLKKESEGLKKELSSVKKEKLAKAELKPFTVKWKIRSIALKLVKAAESEKLYQSPYFSFGNHTLYIVACVEGTKLALFVYKDFVQSADKGPLRIGGSSFIVTKAGVPEIRRTLSSEPSLDTAYGRGFPNFLNDATPFIENDCINVTLEIMQKNIDEPLVL